jgi:hypothetical protein
MAIWVVFVVIALVEATLLMRSRCALSAHGEEGQQARGDHGCRVRIGERRAGPRLERPSALRIPIPSQSQGPVKRRPAPAFDYDGEHGSCLRSQKEHRDSEHLGCRTLLVGDERHRGEHEAAGDLPRTIRTALLEIGVSIRLFMALSTRRHAPAQVNVEVTLESKPLDRALGPHRARTLIGDRSQFLLFGIDGEVPQEKLRNVMVVMWRISRHLWQASIRHVAPLGGDEKN